MFRLAIYGISALFLAQGWLKDGMNVEFLYTGENHQIHTEKGGAKH